MQPLALCGMCNHVHEYNKENEINSKSWKYLGVKGHRKPFFFSFHNHSLWATLAIRFRNAENVDINLQEEFLSYLYILNAFEFIACHFEEEFPVIQSNE